MTLLQFLAFAGTTGGAGAITWGIIAFVGKFVALPSDVKFYGAMLLSFAVPLLAYWAEIGLNLVDFGLEGLFAAVAIGYMVSVTIHRTTGK